MADPQRTELPDPETPLYRRWWFWLAAGILMFLLGYLVGRSLAQPYYINPLNVRF